jgi:flagellar hook-basal body complex protein FliE
MAIPIDGYIKAAAAYAKVARGDAASEADNAAGGSSFADMLKGAVADTIASGRDAETASVAAMNGGSTDLTHVVTAVSEAEVALQTAVAVRERIIESYKEIMRMPI